MRHAIGRRPWPATGRPRCTGAPARPGGAAGLHDRSAGATGVSLV